MALGKVLFTCSCTCTAPRPARLCVCAHAPHGDTVAPHGDTVAPGCALKRGLDAGAGCALGPVTRSAAVQVRLEREDLSPCSARSAGIFTVFLR